MRWWVGADKVWRSRGQNSAVVTSAPVARFTTSARGYTATLDASTSTDTGSTLSSYVWDFGDGTFGSGQVVTHQYTQAGTFGVSLTVTDLLNASATVQQPLTVTVGVPVAQFTWAAVYLATQFDGSASTDTGATVTGWAWTYGDGTSGTGQKVSHTYTAGGTYTATLTVTDSTGQTATVSHTVAVSAQPANINPTASFSQTISGPTVSVNASSSSDPDGSVVGWAWTWGDSTSGSGQTASHTYAVSGSYPVTLTVTDDRGGIGNVTKTVTVNVPTSDGFIYGTTKPTASNTGVGITGLGYTTPTQTYTGSYAPTADVTITSQVINHPIAPAAGVTVTLVNCIIQSDGSASSLRLLSVTNANSHIIARYCDIRGIGTTVTQADEQDGVGVGATGGTTANPSILTDRCHLYHLNDGWNPNAGVIADRGSFIELFTTVFEPNPPRTDYRNHNDGTQITGGSGHSFLGTRFRGLSDPATSISAADAAAAGSVGTAYAESCVMLTPNPGPITNLTFNECWFDGGQIMINGLSWTSSCTGAFTGNRFGRTSFYAGQTAQFKTGTTGGLTWSGNTFEDNGAAVSIIYK